MGLNKSKAGESGIKMAKYQHHVETEKQIMRYLDKKSKETPLKLSELTISQIAKNINVELKEVKTALENLSNEKNPKVEELESDFSVWVPTSEEGNTVRDILLKKKVMMKTSTFYIFSIILLITSYFILEYTINYGIIKVTKDSDYFMFTATLVVGSVWLSKFLSHKWFVLNYYLEKIPGHKWLTWFIIVGILALVFLYKNGLTSLWFIISGIVDLIAIIGFVYNVIISTKKNE